jgi:hypothetical protein
MVKCNIFGSIYIIAWIQQQQLGVAGYSFIAFIWMLWQSFGLWVGISSAGTDYYNNNNDDDS